MKPCDCNGDRCFSILRIFFRRTGFKWKAIFFVVVANNFMPSSGLALPVVVISFSRLLLCCRHHLVGTPITAIDISSEYLVTLLAIIIHINSIEPVYHTKYNCYYTLHSLDSCSCELATGLLRVLQAGTLMRIHHYLPASHALFLNCPQLMSDHSK